MVGQAAAKEEPATGAGCLKDIRIPLKLPWWSEQNAWCHECYVATEARLRISGRWSRAEAAETGGDFQSPVSKPALAEDGD